jgi:hypothetical protein
MESKRLKVKCPKCKKSFKGDDYIDALLNCPYYTCGLKQSTVNNGVGVGTQEALIKPLAVDYCSRPGSKPGTPTKLGR